MEGKKVILEVISLIERGKKKRKGKEREKIRGIGSKNGKGKSKKLLLH